VGIACFFGLEFIITQFFPEYVDGITAARVMILGIIPMTVNALINARLLGTGKSKIVLIGSVTYIASLFSLMFFLGSTHQLLGLAIALVASLTLQSAVLLGVASRTK
jgi:O-antigen/teichoic acid export membrane protein